MAGKFGLNANKSSPALSILTGFDNFQSDFQSYFVFISVDLGSVKFNLADSDRKQLSTAY